ncbi:nucleotidyl transferase AbiEii/AbiGii toxin family protein [Dinghuibacter silviterrae]|uniref:Nucleotidyltransferase AbiEii toxin of type IV toxin-antitoxin system n=1 Tax=Dinghuibacter silviterrae TaxID=1539049 RepID=A0A4V3GKR2_9BACT|nr:nucleotidyl transferase AbiEii/AbiGii toxin family protein [Dinghuibacter silviterrae]TDW96572.1 nucleotidyltransferase AbiEii toxin of type IV toxin-antitoxin system [Dinghuibacter silviterrae]
MSRLYWNTTRPILQMALRKLMAAGLFAPFRLVGGTSLSLQLGHRMSDDIDLFTDDEYNSAGFDVIDQYLREQFPYVTPRIQGPIGMGTSYMVGENDREAIKLDLYYTDAFIQPPLVEDGIRMATIEEIAAMKIDIVQRQARKKDFFDVHELLDSLTLDAMIQLHKKRYPYNHNESTIRRNFIDFSKADGDFDPICLRGKYWEVIKWELSEVINSTAGDIDYI